MNICHLSCLMCKAQVLSSHLLVWISGSSALWFPSAGWSSHPLHRVYGGRAECAGRQARGERGSGWLSAAGSPARPHGPPLTQGSLMSRRRTESSTPNTTPHPPKNWSNHRPSHGRTAPRSPEWVCCQDRGCRWRTQEECRGQCLSVLLWGP